jgi:spore coat polysaccharide biosynthesis predicted glycosyltransferase SpsG
MEGRLMAERLQIHRLPVEAGSDADARATAGLARDIGADWAVVDGYHFTGHYQRLLKDTAMRILAIDDNGLAEHYWADIVLNQNLHAREALYPSREPNVRMLLGPRYALLRGSEIGGHCDSAYSRTRPRVTSTRHSPLGIRRLL